MKHRHQYHDDRNTTIIPAGVFMHVCEKESVFKATIEDVPLFNSFLYFKNREKAGKIDEVFGPVDDVYFSVINEKDVCFKKGDRVYIPQEKILKKHRFFQPPPKRAGASGFPKKDRSGGDSSRKRDSMPDQKKRFSFLNTKKKRK